MQDRINASMRGLVEKGGQDSGLSLAVGCSTVRARTCWSDNSVDNVRAMKGACVADNRLVSLNCVPLLARVVNERSRGVCEVPSISSLESCMIPAYLQRA